jgi:hypothetical protein
MRPKTNVAWIDAAIEQADREGFPVFRAREDCHLLYIAITGNSISLSTYRRKPIPTKVVDGRATQCVPDVVARARRAIEEAPPHMPAASRRRRP